MQALQKNLNNSVIVYKVLENINSEEKENSEEADKVAVRITEILSDNSFNFIYIYFTWIIS